MKTAPDVLFFNFVFLNGIGGGGKKLKEKKGVKNGGRKKRKVGKGKEAILLLKRLFHIKSHEVTAE